jgi:hypothetical protein
MFAKEKHSSLLPESESFDKIGQGINKYLHEMIWQNLLGETSRGGLKVEKLFFFFVPNAPSE